MTKKHPKRRSKQIRNDVAQMIGNMAFILVFTKVDTFTHSIMEKYLENVYDIYGRLSREEKELFYPGPRLTGFDNESPKYLILGINPSNSYKPHAEFSKETCDDLVTSIV